MKSARADRRWLSVLGLALALGLVWTLDAVADGHGRKKKRWARQATDPAYAQACGQCHMVYPSCLLPAGSWRQLLEGRLDHFGQSLTLSASEAKEIGAFLEAGAADRAGGKRSRKVMESLGGATPLRPSEVPYLQHKHRKLGKEVLARPAVGGLGNCRACHPGAEQCDFDDDRVSIPR